MRLTNPSSTIFSGLALDYLDASARIETGAGTDLRFGVVNIDDNQPPLIGTAYGNSDASTYDVIGRRFFQTAHTL